MNGLNGYESTEDKAIANEFLQLLHSKNFVCIAAKAAAAKRQVKCLVVGHPACPKDDLSILQFLYAFVDQYRQEKTLYHSAAIIFKSTPIPDAESFDCFLWSRLQALSDTDARHFSYDRRVSRDPSNAQFSFSLKEEAFFVIGLHPENGRLSRRFNYPVIIFNPHAQFEELRRSGKYEQIKKAVRKRDEAISGSVNPMLRDFGEEPEVFQYSGKQYEAGWQCPLKINHAR